MVCNSPTVGETTIPSSPPALPITAVGGAGGSGRGSFVDVATRFGHSYREAGHYERLGDAVHEMLDGEYPRCEAVRGAGVDDGPHALLVDGPDPSPTPIPTARAPVPWSRWGTGLDQAENRRGHLSQVDRAPDTSATLRAELALRACRSRTPSEMGALSG